MPRPTKSSKKQNSNTDSNADLGAGQRDSEEERIQNVATEIKEIYDIYQDTRQPQFVQSLPCLPLERQDDDQLLGRERYKFYVLYNIIN